jgi:hypothetical protein
MTDILVPLRAVQAINASVVSLEDLNCGVEDVIDTDAYWPDRPVEMHDFGGLYHRM